MRRIAFDVETHLIASGMLFPRLVCASFATYDPTTRAVTSWLRGRIDACREVVDLLRDPDVVLVGHNTAFDLGIVIAEVIELARTSPLLAPCSEDEIMLLVFDAYEANRIACTQIRSMLWDIARGAFQEIEGQRRGKVYGLDKLAERWCGITLAKADTWRLHYAYLTDKPIHLWPLDACAYALGDSEVTIQIDYRITECALAEGAPNGEIPDTHNQTRAAFVLHLIAGWGVRVDAQMVAQLKAKLEQDRAADYALLDQWGVFKKDKLGNYKRTKKGGIQKDQKRLQQFIAEGFAAQGKSCPTTSKGPSTSAEAAEESKHPAAVAFAHVAKIDKLLGTYIPPLERGAQGYPVTSRPNPLVASGRTSWGDPNWQNPPRIGGIRECVIPREGNVLCATDLDTVELRALAQVCLWLVGWSEMAKALQRGQDLHLAVAAEVLGLDYAEAERRYAAGDKEIEEARQTAKKANFSLPGGVGAWKFALMYKLDDQPLCLDANGNYDEEASIARAKVLKNAWLTRWREMRDYLAHAGAICDSISGTFTVEQFWSGRIRGGLDYCSCANTYFQGLVADAVKLAMWRIARACYVRADGSVLFGSRQILFLHDELILEHPERDAHIRAQAQRDILVSSVQEVIPDIPITSTAVTFRRWYKGAKPCYLNGVLVPSKPVKTTDASGKVKTTWEPDLISLAA